MKEERNQVKVVSDLDIFEGYDVNSGEPGE